MTGLRRTAFPSHDKPLGPEAPDAFKILGIPSPDAIRAAIDEIAFAKIRLDEITQGSTDVIDVGTRAEGITRIREAVESLKLPLTETNELLRQMGIEVAQATKPGPWVAFKDQLIASIQPAVIAMQAINTAISTFANVAAQALLRGGTSFKKFVGEMLASMVPILLAWAALGLAAGFFGYHRGFATAAIAGAGAVAAAVASRALGGGGAVGQDPGGRGGGRDFGGVSPGGFGGTQVTVIVQGSLIGTDENELGRSIARWITTAASDGATI